MGSVVAPLWSQTRSCGGLEARHLDGAARCVLELSGEADIAAEGLLRDGLAHMATMSREDVVVDLAKLTFCDVGSAHLLLAARRTTPVSLSGATGPVQRVLDLVDALQMHGLPACVPGGHPQREPLKGPRLSV